MAQPSASLRLPVLASLLLWASPAAASTLVGNPGIVPTTLDGPGWALTAADAYVVGMDVQICGGSLLWQPVGATVDLTQSPELPRPAGEICAVSILISGTVELEGTLTQSSTPFTWSLDAGEISIPLPTGTTDPQILVDFGEAGASFISGFCEDPSEAASVTPTHPQHDALVEAWLHPSFP